jgi:hypothetical protein
MYAWVDYQKGFDSVTHSWINKSVVLIGNNKKLIYFTKKIMSIWKASMRLHTEGRIIETEDI